MEPDAPPGSTHLGSHALSIEQDVLNQGGYVNPSLRALAGLFLSLCLASGALAAPADAATGNPSDDTAMIRVEPEVQPFTEDSSALAKAVRPKAKRAKPVQLAAPAPGEGLQARAEGKTGVP